MEPFLLGVALCSCSGWIWDVIIYPRVLGSSIGVAALRLYGAKVVKDVFFDTLPLVEMDLGTIQNSVILEKETVLMPHVIDNG